MVRLDLLRGRPGTRAGPRGTGRRRPRTPPAPATRGSARAGRRRRGSRGGCSSTARCGRRAPARRGRRRGSSRLGEGLGRRPRPRPRRPRSSGSGASGADEGAAGRGPAARRSTRGRRRPSARSGTRRRGGRPCPSSSSVPRSRAAPASSSGRANGVWLKCTQAQVGAQLGQERAPPGRGGSPAPAPPRRRGPTRPRRRRRPVHLAGRRPRPRGPAACRSGAGGRGRAGRGGGTTAWRCRPRRRPAGRSSGSRASSRTRKPSASTTPAVGGLAVAVGDGGGHPDGVGAGHQRGQARHQPAGAPPADELAVVAHGERHRTSVGDDHDRALGHGGPVAPAPTTADPRRRRPRRCFTVAVRVVARSRQVPGHRDGRRGRPGDRRRRWRAGHDADEVPMADGGEGTLDALGGRQPHHAR